MTPTPSFANHLVGCEVFEDWQGPMLDEKGDRLCIYKPNGGYFGVYAIAEEPPAHCFWMTMGHVRQRLFDMIAATPHLDWLIATERAENVGQMLIDAGRGFQALPPWIWLGVIVSTQAEADARIPALLKVPAAVRWVWCRGMTEEIDISRYHIGWSECNNCGEVHDPNTEHPLGSTEAYCFECGLHDLRVAGHHLQWLAISSPTGPDAIATDLAHVGSVVRQCEGAGVPVWIENIGSRPVTQLGKWESWPGHTGPLSEVNFHGDGFGNYGVTGLKDPDGADPSEWPSEIRVRQLPEVGR
jgi:protein gp37